MASRTLTLRAARSLSPKVRELTFAPDAPMPFVPGQWLNLELPTGGPGLTRSYSIASAPRSDGTFDLAVTHVEGGPGSTFLHAMKVGDVVGAADPRGYFTLPDALAPSMLFVATGTGVAPFRAMIEALAERASPPPTTLLFGVRTAEDLLYRAAFDALAAAQPWFEFVPTLSRASDDWPARRGYVQTHLADLVAARRDVDVWVCGLNAMVREARRTLRETLGLPRDRVHTERFD